METTVGISHCPDDSSHIVKFLVVLRLGPLVLSFRQELLVVLRRIVVCIEKVFKIVETDDIVPFPLLPVLGIQAEGERKQEQNGVKSVFHRVIDYCQSLSLVLK